MKKQIMVFVIAGLVCLFLMGLSNPANAQGYVYDNAWATYKSGGMSLFKGGGAPSPMLPMRVEYASDIAIDSSNNIYVADSTNNRVLKFSPGGLLTMTLGGMEGEGDYEFDSPSGVAVDEAGNIYVADTLNHRVQKFNRNGVFLQAIGVPAPIRPMEFSKDVRFPSSLKFTKNSQIKFPSHVAVRPDGNVIVSMRSVSYPSSTTNSHFYCIKEFAPGTLVSSYEEVMAIDCVERVYPRPESGSAPVPTEFKAWEDGRPGFHGPGPGDIALDPAGNIYAAVGNYIMKFDSAGNYVTQWGGLPDSMGQLGKFRGIKGLSYDSGKLFLTEHSATVDFSYTAPDGRVYYYFRFQVCNAGVIERGISGSIPDELSCKAYGGGEVYGPDGIAVDSAGNVFVSDAKGILKFKFIEPVEPRLVTPPAKNIMPRIRGYH